MAPSGGISGTGLALATAGGLLIWSGLSGSTPLAILAKVSKGGNPGPIRVGSPLSLIKDAISGLNPFSSAAATSGGGVVTVAAGSSALGNQVAGAAAKYDNAVPYLWAGATPAGWDCSGMVTYVLHHDVGLNLPSNTHTTSQQFYVWSGAATIPTSQAQAGDLVCWLTHVAIALSPTECIGAENPQLGTTTGPFAEMGPGGETYLIRRIKPQTTSGALNA